MKQQIQLALEGETKMPTMSVNKYKAGDRVGLEDFITIDGVTVIAPAAGGVVHIQFRRFAGCPVCNLHLRGFVQRREELEASGIHEVIVFHSTVDELHKYEADLPLDVVADPKRRLYARFGVEASSHAYGIRFLPTLPIVAGNLIVQLIKRSRKAPPTTPEGGMFGLPADILVGPDSRIIAIKYGEHAYDQWSVEDVKSIAAGTTV
jgi:peroxiredoxin